MNIETIRIGNENFSSLIVLFDLPYSKLSLIPNLNLIIKDYFVDDINTVYLTNKEELDKGEEGKTLMFFKEEK